MYSPTLSLTSALDGAGGHRHCPAALLPGKTRYPLYRRLGGPQGRSGRVRQISAMGITYFECVSLALVTQHAKLIRRIMSMAYPAIQYFSMLSHIRHGT